MVVYFETGWAILSTICLANVLFGLLVISILSLSPVSIIPVVVSAAGAVANGLCYYGSYADYPVVNQAVASAFADMLWMVQEAGNSFYSYVILSRIIFDWELRIFKFLFWVLMVVTLVARALIAVSRARLILDPTLSLRVTINALHITYFTALALVECISAFFLLRKFATIKKASREASLKASVFRHLMRNSEIRVATLALMGTTRAINYYFQPTTVQKASSTPGQIDRFVYTFECMFPVVMIIDMLASKLASANSSQDGRSFPRRISTEYSHQTRRLQKRDEDDGHLMSPLAATPSSRALVTPFEHESLEPPPKARSSGVSQHDMAAASRFEPHQVY
ncbi:uncharacterized protein DNG_08064 [Cephalotrichum gorgonifer]|uniref:Uncharacterized protein n=1 Tax=Cephalotrichum gorgonifer TaxID=2041049 RepID=A0AAE8N3M7_9PEZI|nr:uncharacterized protein DNG_08064 [Cephalotrichum gorgonifer]